MCCVEIIFLNRKVIFAQLFECNSVKIVGIPLWSFVYQLLTVSYKFAVFYHAVDAAIFVMVD